MRDRKLVNMALLGIKNLEKAMGARKDFVGGFYLKAESYLMKSGITGLRTNDSLPVYPNCKMVSA